MKTIRQTLFMTLSIFICWAVMCAQSNNKINPADIKGNWYLNQWTSYHTLQFTDSTVFVDNSVDTVFTLSYTLSHDTLTTWLPPSNKQFKNKIMLLTPDSLVLEGIHDSKGKLAYSRQRKARRE